MKTKCLTLFLTLSLAVAPTALASGFSDIPSGAWYTEAVSSVVADGLMSGTSPTTFAPDDHASRGMVVTVLWRLVGSPQTEEANPFPDVEDWYYYADATSWAAHVGLTSGKSDGTFAGGESVSREQLAQFLYQFTKIQGGQVAIGILDRFPDKDSISHWAVPALGHAVGTGYLAGTDQGLINPQGSVTRAQLAVVLERLTTPAVG